MSAATSLPLDLSLRSLSLNGAAAGAATGSAAAAAASSCASFASSSYQKIVLEFTDGASESIDTANLEKFGIFQQLQESRVQLKIAQPIFRIVFALIVDDKPIHQAIPEKLLVTPDLVETLEAAINHLHPKNAAQVIASIKNALPLLLTVAQVQELIKTASDAQFYLVAQAKEKFVQQHLFPTQKDAEEHFQTVRDNQVELELACEYIMRLEVSLVKHLSDAHNETLQPQIDGLKRVINEYATKIQALRKKTDLSSQLPMLTLHQLARQADTENGIVKPYAQKAQEILKAYRITVLEALKACGADLSRGDLLEYLIGPKAYFFDYYGFKIDTAANSHSPFIKQITRDRSETFTYRLENNGAYDLELEIWDDLNKSRVLQLPRRCMTKKEYTKPQTRAALEIRSICLPILRNWQNAKDKEITAVKQQLITHFDWKKRNLSWYQSQFNPNDIDIKVEMNELTREKIHIVFIKCRRTLTLNLWDVQTVHCPGHEHEVLKMPSLEEIENDLKGIYTTYTMTDEEKRDAQARRTYHTSMRG